MKLIAGDIIKATINTPFVYHSGIIVVKDGKLMVAHNTPMRKNRDGGNVVVESLNSFLKAGRKIVSRRPTSLTYSDVMASVEKVKKIPFNLMEFNCDGFIYYVRTGKKHNLRVRLLNTLLKRYLASKAKSSVSG